MRIQSVFVFTALVAIWGLLTSLNPSNPPVARTGAPGETTCQQATCHGGGAFTGTVTISGVPDTVVANQVYTITLTNASNAVRAGFQLTCLDAANVKCGTLTAGSGNNIASGGGRQYVRQSTPKNLSGGSASWSFSWKAPATLTSDSLKFYFVSLAANGNGNNQGDNVLISNKKAVFKSLTSGTADPEADRLVQVFPNPASDLVRITLSEIPSGQLTLFDAAGKAVLYRTLDADNQLDVSALPNGIYLAEIRLGERIAQKRLVVEH